VACPPFGHVTALAVYVDEGLFRYREVWASAGTPHVNFAVEPRQLAAATGGVVADVTED
jgi:prolyl-tRNA editing enzyme YbaK/EbsC (Cys-tRNA(Pro) deacylase)